MTDDAPSPSTARTPATRAPTPAHDPANDRVRPPANDRVRTLPQAPAPGPAAGSRWQRLWRHAWLDEADARRLLPADARQRLADHVRDSETRHGGEIRLCIEASLPLGDIWRGVSARQRALQAFAELGVWDTEHNNGVLIYLLLADHAIEIVADRGLRKAVPAAQWQRIVQLLGEALSAAHPEEGLHQAIDAVGALLDEHFPADPLAANPNELPNLPVMR